MRPWLACVMVLGCGSPASGVVDAGQDAAIQSDASGLTWETVETISNDGQVIVERVSYRSDGLRIFGRVCRPVGAGRYKVAVYNHGGFSGLDLDTNLASCPAVAKLGYVWISSSYRGEDGSEGKIEVCLGEVTDVLRMIDVAVDQPYVDPAHIIMWGGSHGGCITTRALQRGAPVRAAIDVFGPADVATTYQYWLDQIAAGSPLTSTYMQLKAVVDTAIGGPPSSFASAYAARSPINFIADVPAAIPFMVLQGGADPLVPPSQSCNLGVALGLQSYHLDVNQQPTTAVPAGCTGIANTWTSGARPTPSWPGNHYLVLYDGLGHGFTGNAGMTLLQDVATFGMVKW